MNPFVAFVLGLLIGWLVEWVIDWVYWRRRSGGRQIEANAECRSRVFELEQEVASYRSQLSDLQAERAQMEAAAREEFAAREEPPAREAFAERERLADREDLAAAVEPVVHGEPALDLPEAELRGRPPVEAAPRRDRLEEIGEVSPGLADCLYKAGIFTFADLGRLRPHDLRALAPENLNEPGSEVRIVRQARLAAGLIQKVDDLEIIDGIGPVIARLLNDAGIFTFAELSELSEEGLRAIVGERIQRLANEGSILRQARHLAGRQD